MPKNVDFVPKDDYNTRKDVKKSVGDVYDVSPNRIGDSKVRGVIETIANYVSKIPEVNAKFEGTKLLLKTQRYAPPTDMNVQKSMQEDMDGIAKSIPKMLKDKGHPSVKIKHVDTDFRPMGQQTNRTVAYCITSVYEIESK